jgi:endo-alpha-1,4-polygalactosaminidase (GH114 family)
MYARAGINAVRYWSDAWKAVARASEVGNASEAN